MNLTLTREELVELRIELELALELHAAHHDSVCAWPDASPNKWELVQHYISRVIWCRRLLAKLK